MKAIVTIIGNQREGYTVEMRLPSAWVEKFSQNMDIRVWGEPISPEWRKDSAGDEYRCVAATYSSLPYAEKTVAKIKADIEQAKVSLAAVVQTEKTIEIDL